MIAAGYMYKRLAKRPDWLKSETVNDICSVSSCTSTDFADWIQYWQHNGYGFFDTAASMQQLAVEHAITLHGLTLFFYEIYEKQWDEVAKIWGDVDCDDSQPTQVTPPATKTSLGFDIVCYCSSYWAECSPLSCNHLAEQFDTNDHCLLPTLSAAIELLEQDALARCEPGPYRIIEVFICP